MRRAKATTWFLGGVAVAGSVVALAAVTRPAAVPATLAAPATPRSVPVTVQTFPDERTVAVRLDVSPVAALAAPRSGRVTSTSCRPGVAVRSGTALARIDERPVLALHTSVPLYRTLSAGSKGPDVRALQAEARRLGHPVTVDGRFGPGTARAVKGLQKRSGMTDPKGSLDPADVVWLPSPSVVPDKCDAVLGAAVGPGTALATVPGRLTAVRASLPADARGARVLEVFGATARVPASGVVTAPAFLRAVEGSDDYASYLSSGATDKLTGSLRLAAPIRALKVPPAAVFGIEGDLACVESGARVIPVTIVGSGLGASLVTTTAAAPRSVDVGTAVSARTCRAAR